MRQLILFFLLSSLSIAGYSQTVSSVDSLLYDSQFDVALNALDVILKKTSNKEERDVLENKRAEILIRAGKFEDAEILLNRLLSRASSPDVELITETNRGLLFLHQGRNDLALTTLQKALAVVEKQNRQNTLEGAQILSYLGNLYLATGKYSQAEEQLRMALTIRQHLAPNNNELIAASYNDLGLVYNTTDPNKALDHYEKALAIYESVQGKDHPKTAIAKTNIGFVYRTLEFFGDAIINFESALEIWKKIYPAAHPTKAFILFNLGQTYLKMRNEKAAAEFYDQALMVYRESHGKKHPAIATVLNAIGSLRLAQGEFDEAISYFQAALISNVSDFDDLNINQNPKLVTYYSGNTLLYSLLHKAEALEARYFGKTLKFKELSLALETLHVCDSLIHELRQQITSESDKILLGSAAAEVYAAGVRIAFEAGQVAARKKHWHEMAFYFAERSKAAVLLEAISDSNAKSFAGIPESLLEEEHEIKSEIAVLTQRLASKPDEGEEKYLRQIQFTLNRRYENFVRDLEAKFPAYYNLKFNVSTPSIAALQNKLNDGTLIVSYSIDEKNNRLYVFHVTSKTFKAASHPITTNFERNINGLRNSLVYNQLEIFSDAAQQLSSLLLSEKIPATVTDLLILPTGKLSLIPFETLFYRKLREENSFGAFPYVIKKYSVRYGFSAAMILQKSEASREKSTSIYLCAPVVFQKEGLVELPGSESEVKDISGIFSAKNLVAEVATRDRANERSVKTAKLKDFGYIHFATHGIVDEANPDLSRVYLHESTPEEDGRLYAGEIYNLELDARLVTLSACQTGLGKISKGEGVIGLSRALAYAGSENMVVSFWSVADESTAALMKHFYNELISTSNENFSGALQRAKLNLISGKKFDSPYYWAPFILIGY